MDSGVCWIDGPFGAGKTTLTQALAASWPRFLLFDPEEVGFMLRRIVEVPTGDFQDLPVWRRGVIDTALSLHAEYGRPLLVPMTVKSDVLPEIFGGLRSRGLRVAHFFLRVPAATLRERIEAQVIWSDDPVRDEQARQWRLAQVDRCVAAEEQLPAGTAVLDGLQPTGLLVDQVLSGLGVTVAAAPNAPVHRPAGVPAR